MKKIKVGIFVDAFYPIIDGVSIGVNSLAKILKDYVDLTVFTIAPGNAKYDDSNYGYKIVRCKTRKIPFFRLAYDWPRPATDKEFLKIIKESNLDIVHIRSPFGVGRQGIKYARKHNIPSVMTLHSQYKQDFMDTTKSAIITAILTRRVGHMFNVCTEAWAINNATAELLKTYGCKKNPYIMENGTDMQPIINKQQAKDDINNEYHIDPDEKVLLYVGRMVKLKNIDFTAAVMKVLKNRGMKFKMIYVGDGPDLDEFKQRIDNLGLKDNVIFVGKLYNRENLAKFYVRSDLFMFPSFYDTDGVVKREAACQDTPTICIENSIVAKTVIKDHNAYVAPNNDELFADEIIKALSDTDKYNFIRENAKKELYRTWQTTAQLTLERYKYILENYKY